MARHNKLGHRIPGTCATTDDVRIVGSLVFRKSTFNSLWCITQPQSSTKPYSHMTRPKRIPDPTAIAGPSSSRRNTRARLAKDSAGAHTEQLEEILGTRDQEGVHDQSELPIARGTRAAQRTRTTPDTEPEDDDADVNIVPETPEREDDEDMDDAHGNHAPTAHVPRRPVPLQLSQSLPFQPSERNNPPAPYELFDGEFTPLISGNAPPPSQSPDRGDGEGTDNNDNHTGTPSAEEMETMDVATAPRRVLIRKINLLKEGHNNMKQIAISARREANAATRTIMDLRELMKFKDKEILQLKSENSALKVNVNMRQRRRSVGDSGGEGRSSTSSLDRAKVFQATILASGISTDALPVAMRICSDMRVLAGYISMEICPVMYGNLEVAVNPTGWFPNDSLETVLQVSALRDWRGRSVSLLRKGKALLAQEEPEIHEEGAVFHAWSADGDRLTCTHALVPKCPFTLACHTVFYDANELAVKHLLHGALLHVKDSNITTADYDVDSVLEEVYACAPVRRRLNDYARDACGTRKKAMRKAYLELLGYGRLVGPVRANETVQEKRERLQSISDLHSRTIVKLQSGDVDTTTWRKRSFLELSHDNAPLIPDRTFDVDALFNNEPARKAFDIWRGDTTQRTSTDSIVCLIRCDAWITALLEDMPRQKTSKGGTEPSVLKSRYIALLPYAAERVLYECGAAFLSYLRERHGDELRLSRNGGTQEQPANNGTQQDANSSHRSTTSEGNQQQPNILLTEMKLTTGADITSRLNNAARLYTTAFQYPQTGRIYIRLRRSTFRDAVCSWLGAIVDCYVVQAASSEARMERFSVNKKSEILNVITDESVTDGVSNNLDFSN